MEIGGYDLLYDTTDPIGLVKRIIDFVNWPDAVRESAFDHSGEENDFFLYKNAEAKAGWDKDGAIPELENTMIYFLIREDHVTVVVDKEMALDLTSFLGPNG